MIQSRKQLRVMIAGKLKDKASLIKASLTAKRTVSSIRVAIIRATTHTSTSPPPEHRIAALLDFGDRSPAVISACVGGIMDRLHGTHNPFVALKCLYVIHTLIVKGSLSFKNHLCFYPGGGRNSLNLSNFKSNSGAGAGAGALELSAWVRWYAGVVEQSITTFRVLGDNSYVSCSSRRSINFENIYPKNLEYSGDDKEMECLVGAVEGICRAPESLDWRKNDVVHEVMSMVAEDYRSAQYRVLLRLGELHERVGKLSYAELTELRSWLERLEKCKERMVELFIRRRNGGFWEMVRRTKAEVERVKEEWEMQSMVLWNGDGGK
ncbi:unnamed protein product [Cuscuta epithymum]|uniref:ENTH domain-containing protein n=1 Tax=Cuscuta epithymum TaxID=186058 RepID=A0AAV0ECD3_9ASTE|nr:unnamed protein product [Cuscuta epithymum]